MIRVKDPWLTYAVKLPDFGSHTQIVTSTKEDIKVAALARRAQYGEYSEGNSKHSTMSSEWSD